MIIVTLMLAGSLAWFFSTLAGGGSPLILLPVLGWFLDAAVIPQLILSLCTMSIATCNKLFENMTLFNGDQKDTKIIGTVNGKTFIGKLTQGLRLRV